MTATQRVLVVDDDATVSDVVRRYLEHSGYAVQVADDGEVALRLALDDPPDIIILDLMLPRLSGLQLLEQLHAVHPTPVVVLTALGDEADRLVGLERGADDYVTKPFSPRELVLRVRSVLRRATAPRRSAGASSVLVDGDLRIDLPAHEVRRGGASLSLTVREFDLLTFLVQHPGQAFNRAELLQAVWGWEFADQSTVTVHVRRLREKIEVDPAQPRRVVTVFGVGYRYQPDQ